MTEGLQPPGRTGSAERLVRVLSRVVAGADFALAAHVDRCGKGIGKAAEAVSCARTSSLNSVGRTANPGMRWRLP